MHFPLQQVASLTSGIYCKSAINADTLYIQATDFDENGKFNPAVPPRLKLDYQTKPHLLQHEDILFAAKGRNNFAVVYTGNIGAAVASSSLVIVRINEQFKSQISPAYLAWYLTHSPAVKQFPKLGTTVPSISIKQLSTLQIEIPASEKQQQILHLQQLRDRERNLINKIQTLKDEFIQRTLLHATK